MPSATAFFPDLTPYFKLDGSRTITGPSTLALSAGNAAFDALTIRGAAGQTGKLLVLETSALADVLTVDVSGNLVVTGGLTGGAISGTTINGSGLATVGTLASGAATITPAANTVGLTLSGASLTGSNAQSLLSLSETWNTTGTPTALLLNITNTASNANSKLIDLQAGGTSRFNIRADGTTFIPGGFYAGLTTAATTRYLSSAMILTSGLGAGSSFARFTHNNSTIALDVLSNSHVILQQTAGNIGLGIASPVTKLHAVETDAVTNAITNIVTVGHNSSGTPAANFGTGLLFQGESSTTENRDMGRVRTLWTTATDASRKARLVLSAFDTAERDGIAIEASGTAAMLGFFGGTPAAKPALGAWAGLTTDQKLDALRDALNTLSLASYT